MRKNTKEHLQRVLKRGVLCLCVGFFCTMFVACQPSTTTTTNEIPITTTQPEVLDVISEDSHAVLYDGPEKMTSSQKVDIFVNDEELFVYETLVNYGRVFSFTQSTDKVPLAIWDFEGKVTVKIVVHGTTVTSAKVTPSGYGIEASITDGNTITFELAYPTSYTVEYNGDYHNAIHLFTNRIEEETYDPQNLPADVLYIGPGVYKADNIPVHSNMTVYIAGGAVVFGKIRTENMENITIKGRGIIDGSIYPRSKDSEYTIPIELRYSQNITIDGITFLNPAGWCMAIYFCDDIKVKNVNIVTARGNGDGISVQSSKNVHVQNCFLRTWDDALVVKNYDLGTTENILFEDVIIWTDLAQSMEVGYETYGATMTNITFRNITILHNFHKPVISIHNSDQAAISYVTFQNITVEDAQMIGDNAQETTDDFLIEIFIRYNLNWSNSGAERGTIDNVLIDNLVVTGGKADFTSLIHGADSTHRTDNVTISNCQILGEAVNGAEDLHLTTNEFVGNINYSYEATKVTGARVYHPYVLNLPADDTPVIELRENISQEGYIVPEFARAEAVSSYMGPKVTGEFVANSTRGTAIAVYDDGTGSYDLIQGGSGFTIDGDKTNEWRSQNFTELSSFYALTIQFSPDLSATKAIGTIRLFGNLNSEIYQIQKIAVYGIKAGRTAYSKLLSSDEYEFSPSSGNVVDIKIRSGEYKSIQLRFYDAGQSQSPNYAFLSEIEFYPASLSYNKAVTGTIHEDVYVINACVDGNPNTYYESAKPFPAEIIIDLAAPYNVKYFSLYLPPKWENRTQEIEILGSLDGINFTVIQPKTAYDFLTSASNVVEIVLATPESAQFIKFVIYSNTSGYGAQISEISIFE